MVDTIISPEFIEKNISVLESQDKAVGCISKIKIDESYNDKFENEKKLLKKFGIVYRPSNAFGGEGVLEITGSYMERIRKYLKHFPWEMFYSVYRTEALRESFVHDFFIGHDAGLALNVLKHGEIQVVNQFLLESFPSGTSSEGMMQLTHKIAKSNTARIFPFYPLTKWCVKNLGWKIFFRNIDHFLRLGFDGLFLQSVSVYQNTKT